MGSRDRPGRASPEETDRTEVLRPQPPPSASSPARGARSAPPARARYQELGELARGGMSTIFEVFDQTVQRRVAMKVFDRERDPDGLQGFVEEAQLTGQLDHPNIVPVHDIETDSDGLPTRFAMKLVEGETLAALLAKYEPAGGLDAPGLQRMLDVFLKVCDAVSFAHSRGVLHRDLKPGNIMVGTHGQVYVMDWGIALRTRSHEPQPSRVGAVRGGDLAPRGETPGTLSGTPAYMAPEQARGELEHQDERTDVYGLGGILYSILTLRPPHDGGSTAADLELARSGAVRAPTEAAPNATLPPGLCRIAMRALGRERDERYPTVAALRQEAERFMRGGGWFETVRCKAGDVIVSEGDAPDAAYMILEGQCELYRGHGAERRFMRLMGAGEVFGETSIFGSSPRTASVRACSDVALLRVTRQALDLELERADWLRAFVEAMAERFIELDQKLRRLQDRGDWSSRR